MYLHLYVYGNCHVHIHTHTHTHTATIIKKGQRKKENKKKSGKDVVGCSGSYTAASLLLIHKSCVQPSDTHTHTHTPMDERTYRQIDK